jgi:ketosteroid isomerase-like protein
MKKIIFACLALSLFISCNDASTSDTTNDTTQTDMSSVRSAIDAQNQKIGDAFAKGDSVATLTYYHPEAVVFAPNMEKITDPKQMASMITWFPKMGIREMELKADELYEGKDVVTEVGHFEMRDSAKVVDKGNYLVVWKKDGETWKIFRDTWTSEMPATAGSHQ